MVFQKDHTFALSLADGTSVGTSSAPGTTIPAGTYRVNVDDTAQAVMQFHLAGPGVELVTNMTFGEDAAQTLVETFQPSSTYTFRDDFQPSLVRYFSTSSNSISSGGSGGGASTGGTPAKSQSGGGLPTISQDIVGSEIQPFRGTLAGAVSPAGKLTLTFKGRSVASLRSGRYRIAVDDETAKSAFMVQRLKKQPVTVTGHAFVGRRTVTVTLDRGQWWYFSGAGKKKTYFIVVK